MPLCFIWRCRLPHPASLSSLSCSVERWRVDSRSVSTLFRLPYIDSNRAKGNMPAIGRPRNCLYIASIPAHQGLARRSIPHLHRLIPCARGDALAIGRPGDCLHPTSMPAVRHQYLACLGIPHLHLPIPYARGNTPATIRPPNCHCTTTMPPP